MLIAGAGGHAKEILTTIIANGNEEDIFLFDDSGSLKDRIFKRYKILKSIEEVKELFKTDNKFLLGVGRPKDREELNSKLSSIGGELCSIISEASSIGVLGVELGPGLNIMSGAIITTDVIIRQGTLIHVNSSVHHGCLIGKFCEISPGSVILGNVKVGDFCSIGAGAIILPNVNIGHNVVVGAGAVVTKDVQANKTVLGVPAKVHEKNN